MFDAERHAGRILGMGDIVALVEQVTAGVDMAAAQKLAEAEKELFNLRIQRAAGQLEKPDRIRTVKREIARIKTVMNQAKAAR